ncbi:hypothetical protein HMPREF3213_01447 [Heyndrickxia coagulans]|uniref:Uncharacterized protein n=1 Tax=Heyndrickxia coagulans TaxID=1398 RepID=A0A133KTY6_HEYCO|nr:hypothetical protein HMPREF3213_01447 [Heyndrickxia coagulans]
MPCFLSFSILPTPFAFLSAYPVHDRYKQTDSHVSKPAARVYYRKKEV